MRGLGKWLVRAGLVVWSFGAVAAVSGVWVTMPPIVSQWRSGTASTTRPPDGR